MTRLIWWIRRDFRLEDNSALAAALRDADEVIPVFILDDRLLRSPRLQGPRVTWMLDGLRVLDATLRRHRSSLIIRRGKPVDQLMAICRAAQAQGIYFNRDYSGFAVARDNTVTKTLMSAGIRVKSFKDAVIHEACEVANKQGKPYEVFSPFHKAWLALPKPEVFASDQPFDRLKFSLPIDSESIPSGSDLNCTALQNPIVPPGETNAKQRLTAFVAGSIFSYEDHRNSLAADGTGVLSPYLRWGMISPRECYWAAVEALDAIHDDSGRRGVHTWISELVWREFFYELLARNPSSVTDNLRPDFDHLVWEGKPEWLTAWVEGRTGYPVVDAAMRQLKITGWMHNRARLITASFLCKDLLIDWRSGEAVFMQHLIDGDVASNVGNWQWSAGTGADAAPYFRIFNPALQSAKYDPDGDYIRQWVPELANVPTASIHTPHKMTVEEQGRNGCVLGRDYPLPIVDHAIQRKRALAMYADARTRGDKETSERSD